MSNLIQTLLSRKLIREDAMLSGRVPSAGLGGITTLVKKNVIFVEAHEKEYFVCKDIHGNRCYMRFSDLEAIDGMDLPRYAKVYNIKADGGTAKTGKKRGRKPKAAAA